MLSYLPTVLNIKIEFFNQWYKHLNFVPCAHTFS